MIVIVPHPTQELLLIKAQKELIKKLFEPGKIIYAHTPLWIPTGFETVEQAKNEITDINIYAPEYDQEHEGLVCPVEIKTRNGIVNSKLNFIDGLLRCAHNDEAIFPLRINIFRIGECTVNNNIYALSNSVWKKIK